MSLVNRNNQKVKLADGLTEIGMSQVKSEVGGGEDHLKLYIKEVSDAHRSGPYIVNPTTKEVYIGDRSGSGVSTEEANAVANQIVQDYGFQIVLSDTEYATYTVLSLKNIDVYFINEEETGSAVEVLVGEIGKLCMLEFSVTDYCLEYFKLNDKGGIDLLNVFIGAGPTE